MIAEHEIEAIPGLPGRLPAGERVVWQGKPQWRPLARTAFRTRLVALYFAALTLVAVLAGGTPFGIAMTAASGVAAVGVLSLMAWATARGAVYTITDRRVVLRVGVAVPKCINLPLKLVAKVDLAAHAGGGGDVVLTVNGTQSLGYLALWPHARPWRLATPQPMLRCIPDAERVGTMLARLCLTMHPAADYSPTQTATGPVLVQAAAA